MVIKFLKYTVVGFMFIAIVALVLFIVAALLASLICLLVGTFVEFLKAFGLATFFTFCLAACLDVLIVLHHMWFE